MSQLFRKVNYEAFQHTYLRFGWGKGYAADPLTVRLEMMIKLACEAIEERHGETSNLRSELESHVRKFLARHADNEETIERLQSEVADLKNLLWSLEARFNA
jgi:hypothetical protein